MSPLCRHVPRHLVSHCRLYSEQELSSKRLPENNVHLPPYNGNDDVRNTSKTPLWEQVKDAMRRMTGNYLYILVGLSLAWLMAMGCAAEPAAVTPTTTEIVSNGTPEPATPATALTPTSPSPDVDDAAATAPPHRESNSATPAATLTAAAGSEKRDSLADSSLAYIGETWPKDWGPERAPPSRS